MRSRVIPVPHKDLLTVLRNIEKNKGFKNHFGFNTEPIVMTVEASLSGDDFCFYIKVPGHVFENIQTKAFEEALFNDVSL